MNEQQTKTKQFDPQTFSLFQIQINRYVQQPQTTTIGTVGSRLTTVLLPEHNRSILVAFTTVNCPFIS